MVLVALVSCSDREQRAKGHDTDEPAPSPLSRIRLFGDSLAIYPAPDVPWDSLVDLSPFGQFLPNMTCEEAERAFGPASRQTTTHRGRYCEYDRDRATIMIGWEETHSGLGGVSKGWTLRARPYSMTYSEFFHPSVESQIKSRVDHVSVVTLMKAEGGPALHVELAAGKVISVKWLADDARRHSGASE